MFPYTLQVVIQTYTAGNSQKQYGQRVTDTDKREVTFRCLKSLVTSINESEFPCNLHVVDDHSSTDDLITISTLLDKLNHPHTSTLENLQTTGIMPSIRRCYEVGLETSHPLFYFTQDDYLHYPSAISEMVNAYNYFGNMLYEWFEMRDFDIGITPHDDCYRYQWKHNIQPVNLVHGPKRHWRQNFFTSCVFMTSTTALKNNWDLVDAFCDEPVSPGMEDRTINKIWQQRKVALFSPIPTLAHHVQSELEKDPIVDYRPLWNDNKMEDV